MALEYRILGPLEVVRDGQSLRLERPRERALLALLVVSANRVVSADVLAEDLWAGAPPPSAATALRVYISRLRRALGEDGEMLATRPSGYLLRVDDDAVDALRFEALLGRGRERAAAGDHAEAARVFREALGLWRGPALVEVADAPFARAEAVRLEEARLAAVEDRIDAEMACGDHRLVTGELEALTRAHPLREGLWALRMLALYRSGRHAEALRAYQDVRHLLREELGLEPGEALRELETAVLRHDRQLDAPVTEGSLAATPPPLPYDEGERKQVTVLFAEVVASMDLTAGMDAEEWGELVERFLAILREGANRFEGRIDKFTGDGATLLFGAPVAYEDHARRACAAALHLGEELARFGEELERDRGIGFPVCMGINSGEVVAGPGGRDPKPEYTAVGNAVGLAQRIGSLAGAGTVHLTATTAALVEGYFELRDLGPMQAQGMPEPVGVFQLVRRGALRTPLEVAAAKGFSRFVGRDREMAVLEGAFAEACQGNGQVIGVVAEPGLGKSRLGHEFAERCRAQGVEVFTAHGLAHARSVPFVPVLEILRAQFGVGEQDDPAAARAKVTGVVRELDPSLEDSLPLLYDFLGVADPDRPAPAIDPEARQRRIFRALARLRRARSVRGPVLILVEDLHWLDPGSEDFLENLVGGVPGTRYLVVTTFRPEYRVPWAHRSHYAQLPLHPLGEEASDELLRGLLGQHPSLEGLAMRVRGRTGGNPFFIEEVVQGLVEQGSLRGRRGAYELAETIGEVRIPASVQAVLAARIDRLSAGDKALLQTAAVVGRQFSRRLLGAVTGVADHDLGAALRTLVEAELIYEAAAYPEEEYTFKHALVEEVAYGSQLARRRARVHVAVAQALAELEADKLDERASLIAYHYEMGGELLEAARWNARAAGWAGFSHPVEAARHWRRVRALTGKLEQSPEAAELGINARIMMLGFLFRLGAASEEGNVPYEEEAAAVFAEAEAFAEAAGQAAVKVIVRTLYGLVCVTSGGEAIEEGYKHNAEATRLADETGDPGLRAASRAPLAWALFVLGRVRDAAAMAADMVPIIGEDRSVGRGISITSPYAWCRMQIAHFGAYSHRLDEGLAGLERAIDLAGEEGDLETRAWAHRHCAVLADLAGADRDVAAAHARQGLQWAEEAGGAWSRIFLREGVATSHVQRGEWRQAIEVVDEALAIARDRRIALANVPLLLSIRARAQMGQGDVAGARRSAEEALAVALRCGTRGYEALARLQLARAILSDTTPGEAAATELEEALAIVETLGIRAFAPQIHLERARLALATGDEGAHARELEAAHRLFLEVGAPARAKEVASLLPR